MDVDRHRSAAQQAGAIAGIAGLVAFLAVHHVLILPIWFVAPVGAVLAMLGGVAVGTAYAELQPRLPRRPWTAPAFAILVAVILVPAFVLAELRGPVFRMTAGGEAVLMLSEADVVVAFGRDLLLSATIAGGAVGWAIARTRRAAIATALAGIAFGLGPGHNIPFLGGTSGLPKELALIGAILAVGSVVLVEVHARGVRAR